MWLTYREGVGYTAPDGSTANEAFVRNNATLRERAALASNADVRLADWFAHTSTRETGRWLSRDGIHLTPTGAWGLADYVSRAVASIDDRPCTAPWSVGAAVDDPCPWPDDHAAPADVAALYER